MKDLLVGFKSAQLVLSGTEGNKGICITIVHHFCAGGLWFQIRGIQQRRSRSVPQAAPSFVASAERTETAQAEGAFGDEQVRGERWQ
jgi:hypothetical protein